MQITHMVKCPCTDGLAVLSGDVLLSHGRPSVVREACNVRNDLISEASACDRSCGLGSQKSPLKAYEREVRP